MYDYWEAMENMEHYLDIDCYKKGYRLTLTDDPYYVETVHKGKQVAVYSTNKKRREVSGTLESPIVNRVGRIAPQGNYNMVSWEKVGDFYFMSQQPSFC